MVMAPVRPLDTEGALLPAATDGVREAACIVLYAVQVQRCVLLGAHLLQPSGWRPPGPPCVRGRETLSQPCQHILVICSKVRTMHVLKCQSDWQSIMKQCTTMLQHHCSAQKLDLAA